jgi:hypothetical protein
MSLNGITKFCWFDSKFTLCLDTNQNQPLYLFLFQFSSQQHGTKIASACRSEPADLQQSPADERCLSHATETIPADEQYLSHAKKSRVAATKISRPERDYILFEHDLLIYFNSNPFMHEHKRKLVDPRYFLTCGWNQRCQGSNPTLRNIIFSL